MDKKSISQNKSIQDGLEKFLDQEIGLYDINPDADLNASINPEKTVKKNTDSRSKTLKTEFATTTPRRTVTDKNRNPINVSKNSDVRHKEGSERSGRFIDNDSDEGYRERTRKDEIDRSYIRRESEDDFDEEPYSRRTHEDRYRSSGNKNNRENSSENNRKRQASYPSKHDNRSRFQSTESSKNKGKSKKDMHKGKKNKNPKDKKDSKLKKVIIILILVFLAILIWWYITVGRIYNKMNYEKADELASGSMKEDGVINVLLIGNDSRENGEDGRSDAMILVSISQKTKTIHMTSLLRDMYVEIPGHDGNRLNAAYAYGGPALLCDTIEQNLGIEVNRYALVNFQAFASLVDAVDGVDLEVTNDEVQWINAYLNEYNLLEGKEMTTDYLDTSLSGMIHLNGPQALAYSRNRYIGTDFGRTERQRKVLGAVMKKLPLAMATNSGELINGLFPNVTTNLTKMECYELSLNAEKFLTYETVQSSIPAEGTYSNASIRGMSVLQVDFEANKAILQKEIYGKE